MRNIEVLRDYFLGRDPQLKETLADNSLRLIGISGTEFALKRDVQTLINRLKDLMEKSDLELADEIVQVQDNIDNLSDKVDSDVGDLRDDLGDHINNWNVHLTPAQRQRIEDAITPAELAQAIAEAMADYYTKTEVDTLLYYKQNRLEAGDNITITGNVISATDGRISPEVVQEIEDITTDPITVINPEIFYRFKNLVDNSSFEVFNGQTGVPYGWEGGTVSPDASMFGTYSLMVEQGNTAKVLSRNQPDVTWAEQAYDTDTLVLSFYHKFGGVQVSVYDITNNEYMTLQQIDGDLEPVGTTTQVVSYAYKPNWNRYRDYILITPKPTTRRIRIEFHCPTTGTREVYIDGVSLEPYSEGEYPSIYKDGRYSISAYMVLNPPPGDVNRFTYFEHFNIRNGIEDSNGFLTYQELARADGTLAVKRQASNPDANGFYQTVVETFYKADGVTVEYVDTYSYVFSSSGAIKQRTRTTTEV